MPVICTFGNEKRGPRFVRGGPASTGPSVPPLHALVRPSPPTHRALERIVYQKRPVLSAAQVALRGCSRAPLPPPLARRPLPQSFLARAPSGPRQGLLRHPCRRLASQLRALTTGACRSRLQSWPLRAWTLLTCLLVWLLPLASLQRFARRLATGFPPPPRAPAPPQRRSTATKSQSRQLALTPLAPQPPQRTLRLQRRPP